MSCTDAQIRTYRVSRVIELSETKSEFERPHDFDLASYWRECTERFEAESHTTKARLLLSDFGLRLSVHLLPGQDLMRMSVADKPGEDVWFETTMPVGSVALAASDLLRLA